MTLHVKSTRFGEQEIEDGKVIEMPDGILGFHEKRFVLLSSEKGPFHWLQAVDNPDLAFVVVDPKTCIPDYEVKLTAEEYRKLGLAQKSQTIILTVVTIDKNPLNTTLNLMGPIVLNPDNMNALQIVLESGKYSTRHPYFSTPQAAD
jgi:flagellar assembly factor FliW